MTGPTTLDNNVTTTGNQTYNSAVTLGGTDTLKTTANGSIDFVSTVDGDDALTLSVAGTGTVTFGGAVGGDDGAGEPDGDWPDNAGRQRDDHRAPDLRQRGDAGRHRHAEHDGERRAVDVRQHGERRRSG